MTLCDRVITPQSQPRASSKGLPLLPPVTVASVWMYSGRRAETMPAVRVCSIPAGVPKENTGSPTSSDVLASRRTMTASPGSLRTRMMARSALRE